MPKAEKLAWYARRLAAMSPAEVTHRLFEQVKRRADRGKPWGWASFGAFDGSVAALPGLPAVLSADELARARAGTHDVMAGRLRFLGQDWPPTGEEDWWNGDIWFRDPVSGLAWPGAEVFAFDAAYRHDHQRGDVKFVWEINRLQFLPALTASGEADAAFDILKGWMSANPPYQGINWTGGIEAASRLISVLAMLRYVQRKVSADEAARLRAFIHAHAHWIDRYPSVHSSANNHRVAELAALFLAGLAAPGLPSAVRYRLEGRAGLEREILRQFHADGVGAEQSPTYSAYSLEWFVAAGRAADAAGEAMSEPYRTRAAAAAAHLRWMIDDGGHAPRIGDDDEGRVLSFDLAQAPDYPKRAAATAEGWLKGEKAAPFEPPVGERTFAEGGYTVARTPTGRGTALFVFDHAPLGFLSIAAHGHADALAIWLHWGEEPILVDAGTYLYHSGREARDAFRGTPAHNTLTLDGRDQSRISGPFNWADHARSRLLDASPSRVTAEHTGYVRRYGLVHRRKIDVGPHGYVVEDSLVGASKIVPSSWRIGYLLHPDVSVVLEGRTARLSTPAGRALRLLVETGPEWMIENAEYSEAFNRRTPTHRLVLQGSSSVGDRGVVSRMAIHLDETKGA